MTMKYESFWRDGVGLVLIREGAAHRWFLRHMKHLKYKKQQRRKELIMINQFLLDRSLSEKFEKAFAEFLEMNWNFTRTDDEGIDIYDKNFEYLIDVKVMRRPPRGQYKGVFIEYWQKKSNKPGWYADDKKETTHYLFVKDGAWDGSYDKAWLISKERLIQAIKACKAAHELTTSNKENILGYILPYYYLDIYSEKEWKYGEK